MGNAVIKSAAHASTATMQSGVHRRVSRVGSLLEHPDPALEQPCFDVDPRAPETIEIAASLVGTMKSTPGCWSVSAPQLGYDMRLLCMDVTGHPAARSAAGLVVLANPELLSMSGSIEMSEQCTSFPRTSVSIARASHVVVAGTVPGSGRKIVVVADAFEARRLLHELDHLDGITMLDRVEHDRL